jgi:UDP-N-acetyl-2-amino-2-deoxyglucuronate dehydrogenase
MKSFALIGVGGYIAPRHLQAIRDCGHKLMVALDVNDSVGVLDSYFPEAEFFTEFEEFEAFIQDEKMHDRRLDYLSVCSPNYLHVSHIKFALKNNINVICEKPLVLCNDDLDTLATYEVKYKCRVNSILQLRLHPSIIELRKKVHEAPSDKIFKVELTYITSRGKWYLQSWKGLEKKSGGVAINIGVHFFDMLHFIFGDIITNEVHYRDSKTVVGYLRYKRASVKWFLSIDSRNLPEHAVANNKPTFRNIKIEDEEFEFSGGFSDLHTESYKHIIEGSGFGIDDNRATIKTVEKIGVQEISEKPSVFHPLLRRVIG